MARDLQTLERIHLLKDHVGFQALREEAQRKLERSEAAISRLLFRTRSQVDPLEVEYYRGFRQGVMYVLDGLPNNALAEFEKELAKMKEES